MAEQTVTLPAANIVTDSATVKRWDTNGTDAIVIDTDLYSVAGALYLRRVIATQNDDGFEFRMIFAPTPTFPTSNVGDDLVDEWENYVAALGVEQGANGVASIPGPNHPNNFLRDSAETYRWIIPTGSVATACVAFFFTDLDTTADVSLTFRTQPPAVNVEADGAAIEGHGALGEAEGEALEAVVGDGAAVEGHGALGEAEGEALEVVVGDGAAIEGHGALGEAEGEALAAVVGDGAAIEGHGALGEAEGETLGPVVGDGAAVEGHGALGEAEGETAKAQLLPIAAER